MNGDTSQFEKSTEQWTAFQKIWADTFTRMMQAGFTVSPEAAPPEFLKQMRSGIFQALSQSWDEYLRSPQFLEAMKQWMENAATFRKMTTDLLTKAQHETQSAAREDIDDVLLSIRQIETRLLDRLDELTKQINESKAAPKTAANKTARKAAPRQKTPPSRKKR